MTPKDWRHPRILYAVEYKEDREWRQMEGITPFKAVALRRCAAAFDHTKCRLVEYQRARVRSKRTSHGWYAEAKEEDR